MVLLHYSTFAQTRRWNHYDTDFTTNLNLLLSLQLPMGN